MVLDFWFWRPLHKICQAEVTEAYYIDEPRLRKQSYLSDMTETLVKMTESKFWFSDELKFLFEKINFNIE